MMNSKSWVDRMMEKYDGSKHYMDKPTLDDLDDPRYDAMVTSESARIQLKTLRARNRAGLAAARRQRGIAAACSSPRRRRPGRKFWGARRADLDRDESRSRFAQR